MNTGMDWQAALRRSGFDRVVVLDGPACGIPERRLLLCFALYEAEPEENPSREAVIHPYYPVSQQAYRRARAFVKACAEHGLQVRLRDDIRLKPILNRLPFLRLGRNTLAYLPGQGSRFHVQTLTAEEEIPITDVPEEREHPEACGSCRKCAESCPSGAIGPEGFLREKCLRFWMLNGQLPPPEIREKMGNRLLGCDVCERCCPMNPKGSGEATVIPLAGLLRGEAAEGLKVLIGANYARPNRLLIQGCLLAASLKREDLRPELEALTGAASPGVRAAAEAALRSLPACIRDENDL